VLTNQIEIIQTTCKMWSFGVLWFVSEYLRSFWEWRNRNLSFFLWLSRKVIRHFGTWGEG